MNKEEGEEEERGEGASEEETGAAASTQPFLHREATESQKRKQAKKSS